MPTFGTSAGSKDLLIFARVEKPRFSAVVRAGTSGLGQQRHAGAGISGRKGGDISVGPYSSTATVGDEVGDDAADLIADARPAVMSASSRRSDRSIAPP